MKINCIKALEDNYIWELENEGGVVVVDPGDADPVLKFLKDRSLTGILLTHFHEDHTGGVKKLKEKFKEAIVYGPAETEKYNDYTLKDGDEFQIIGEDFRVLLTAGHTKSHISYLTGGNLFCGDALFLAGCGRVFTKDYEAAFKGMEKFKKLPNSTKIYPAHEYSISSLKFAKALLSGEDLDREYERVEKLREKGEVTLPSTIGKEKKINPFLLAETAEQFKAYRDMKDRA